MSTQPDKHRPRRTLATIGVVLLPVLCCALLPLLITAGVLGAVGSVLGNPWVIGAAVSLLVGVVGWRVWRHAGTATRSDGCCPPEPPGPDQSRPPAQSPSHYEER